MIIARGTGENPYTARLLTTSRVTYEGSILAWSRLRLTSSSELYPLQDRVQFQEQRTC